ncbi:glutathione S-transferase [Xylariaceae sp. FL1019]|nr:glutathione S-transferase [Xylariaceae sp. FL1019]
MPPLTVHHLGVSQSDRVVWLCEELGLDYNLQVYKRSPVLAGPDYKALHPIGAAPVIEDGSIKLAESSACLEYIAQIYGNGRFIVKPGEEDYAEYLYWFHFANATLTSTLMRIFTVKSILGKAEEGSEPQIIARFREKLGLCLETMNERLSKAPFLGGKDLTIADIMSVCSVTTLRCFQPLELHPYPNILSWLERCAAREGYKKAVAKGDPDQDISQLISADGPPLFGPLRA